jgi:hypothetical protein
LLLLPIIIGCSPTANGKRPVNEIINQYSIKDKQPTRIWYYQFGAATNTIFDIDTSKYSEVMSKFSDLKMEQKDTIQKNTTKDFYISIFYDNESVEDKYVIGMTDNIAYMTFTFDGEVKSYTVSISDELYKNAKDYFDNMQKNIATLKK